MTDLDRQIAPVEAGDHDVSPALVSDALKLFARAIRAHQLYLPNNPMHIRAMEAARGAFAELWRHTDEVILTVAETRLVFEEITVLEEATRAGESLPWTFHKDGVRILRLTPGFEEHDLALLIDVVRRLRLRGDEEDLVALLWECDFAHLTYEYVDVMGDGASAPGSELLTSKPTAGTIASPSALENTPQTDGTAGGGGTTSGGFTRPEDFDSTLYFLEEHEIAYLQQALREEFARDPRPPVVAALLDTYECETDPAVRDEVRTVLDTLLLTFLANRELRAIAYLLREVTAAAGRAAGITAEQREQLLSLRTRLSEPDVITQLLQMLEDVPIGPLRPHIRDLFAQLGSSTLETVLSYVARTQRSELRELLEETATRLCSTDTGELGRLIGSSDRVVALEAIRRAAALGSAGVVTPLAHALTDEHEDIRRAVVTALASIGSPGAMQALERAVDDDDRDVRVIAVRTLAERQHRAALSRVDRVLRERVLKSESTSVEKTAFFDAYAVLAGESGVSLLDGILNPRRFLSRKADPQTRALAAAALGRIGSQNALDSLRQAAGANDVVVRTAASRALRGGA